MMFKGIDGSAGIGLGRAVVIKEADLSYDETIFRGEEQESVRLDNGINKFIEKTTQMADIIQEQIGAQEARILHGHIVFAKDPEISSQLTEKIKSGLSAEAAVSNVFEFFAQIFEGTGDELTAQRAADLRDIKARLLGILLDREEIDITAVPKGTVLLAKDLTPSMTTGLNPDKVTGILTETGGKTSHSAILARALEIPAVLSIEKICSLVSDGDFVILDGLSGKVFINPEQEVIDTYAGKQACEKKEKAQLKKFKGVKTVTADGEEKELFANIGSPEDVKKVLECDGEGIGLFRTEFLFMNRHDIPLEEEQFQAYRTVAESMQGKEVIIRTMDIGGDKDVPSLGLEKEENPFLGYRAIRYCLNRTDIFIPQLRALLRASAFGNIKIMVPMVTGIYELRQVKKLITDVKAELTEQDIDYKKDIEVGIMMETPAACMIADILAKEADFFSIGTNDLTGYTMAADRGNANVSYLYSAYNPAVLRAIKWIIECAKKEGIKVGMCGEAAADAKMIPLLLAFGLDEFSVSASAILRTRKEISTWALQEAKELERKVMDATTNAEVESMLEHL